MSTATSTPGWFRRTLGWSNSRQAWAERIGLLFLITAIVLASVFAGRLSPVGRIVVWSTIVLTALVLLRRGWLQLFGPVLFYDMLRSGRRGRSVWVRVTYAGILLFVLMAVFLGSGYRGPGISTAQAESYLAQDFFDYFIWVQFVVLSL